MVKTIGGDESWIITGIFDFRRPSHPVFKRGTVSGYVFHDDNANGVREPSESRGVPGVIVAQDTKGTGNLYHADNPTRPLTDEHGLTDDQGSFSFFAGPEPDGSAILWTELGLTHDESFEKYQETLSVGSITPRSREMYPGRDIGLFERATATGQIFSDFNDNGVKDPDETPSEFRFSVFFDLNGNGQWDSSDEPRTVSDSDGKYSLEGGEFGSVLTVKSSSAFSVTQGETYEVTASGQKFENANFGIFDNVLLAGHVYHDMDGDGARGHEPFLPGINVQLDLHNDGTIDATTTSEGALGYYKFPGVGPGTHRIAPLLGAGQTLSQPTDPNGYVITVEYNRSQTNLNLGLVFPLTVNSTGDLPDRTPEDWVCGTGAQLADGQPECTLRAAIMQANAGPSRHTIAFAIPGDGPIQSASPPRFPPSPRPRSSMASRSREQPPRRMRCPPCGRSSWMAAFWGSMRTRLTV